MKSSRFLAACLALAGLVLSAAPAFASVGSVTATLSADVSASVRTKLQGDKINYTATLTNTSGVSATNVSLTAVPANTTLVPGSVHASPLAFNDSYTAVGNTELDVSVNPPIGVPAVTSGIGLLANDVAITDTLSITANTQPAHGTVFVGSDGSFTYTPSIGYSGVDTFTYTLTNTADSSLTDTGTVTITVGPCVWYLQSNSNGTGNNHAGSAASPAGAFSDLASANGNTGPAAGDIIYLYKGQGTYLGNFTLKASQRLVGQGVDLVVGGVTLVAAGSGNTPTVNGVVTLADSVSLSGLQLSGSNASLAGASVTGITVSLPTVTNTGGGSAINFTSVGGTFAFTSISSSAGSATGIYLNGLTGSFTVSGSGTAGSGGTIASKTGADGTTASGCGIYLNNAQSVSLSRMQLNDFANYAILGTGVTGFSLTYSTINGVNGSNSTTAPEDAISFTNLTGTATIDNCAILGGCVDNLRVANSSGTLNRINITNTTFGLNGAATGNDSVSLSASGTATFNATVNACTFSGARGDIIDFTGQTGTTMDVVVTNNTLANAHPGTLSGGGGVIVQSAGTATFNVASNTLSGTRGRALVVAKGGTAGTLTGTVASNVIGISATSLSGSAEASGIYVDGSGTGKLTIAITGNTVHQTNEAGIYLLANNQATTGNNGTLNATVTGNTVDTPGSLTFAAFFADIGTGVNAEASSAFLDVSGNTFSGTSGAYLGTFDLSAASATAVRLSGYTGGTTDTTAVATYLTGRNALSASTTHITVTAGGTYAGGAAFLTLAPVALETHSTETRTSNIERSTSNAQIALRNPELETPNPELSAATLQATVDHARNLWMDTGLTPAQVALLRGLSFDLADLGDRHLGAAEGARVMIDRRAGWSTSATVPARQLDLLTAILHEMGHTLGLDDSYAAADRTSLMYGYLTPGERRLPVNGMAYGVQPEAYSHLHFVSAALVSIATVPAGKTVTVKFQVTIGSLTAATAQISAQGTWTGSPFTSVATDDPNVAGASNATVTLVGIPPAITGDPSAQSVASGLTATFTASATGAEAPTVQWQVLVSGGTFTNISGATSATYAVTATPALDGNSYRAVFHNSASPDATTAAASLTVTPATLVSIAVTPSAPTTPKGATQQFTATGTYTDASTQNLTSSVTWSSATPGNATISGTGLATAVAASGTSVITATSGSVSGTATLTAAPAALVSIAVTPANPSILKNATQQFVATGTYSDNTTQTITGSVTWASVTTATATINGAGLATGQNVGTSSITATSGSVVGSITLTVSLLPSPTALGAPASVNASDTLSYTVPAGNNRLLVVTASHPDNGGKALTSVTFGTQAMTQAVLSTDTTAAIDSIWILPMGSSATPTTATITVTRNAEAASRPLSFLSAQAFKDANQASPIQTVGAANVSGGTANSTLTITSSATDTVFDLFDTYSASNTLTATSGGGQTAVSSSGVFELKNTGVATYAGYGLWKTSTKPGAGVTTVTSWTSNAAAYLSAAISLKQAPAATAPTIASPTKTDLAGTTATLGANVTADGGAAITKRGVLYAQTSLNNNPTLGGSNVTEVDDSGTTTGSFTAPVTGLTVGTGYSYVGFVTTSVGTSYTSVDTFTTVAEPPVLTLAFGVSSMGVTAATSLSYEVTNNNAFPLTGVSIANTLPAGLVVTDTSTTTNGTLTAIAGSSTVSLSGATISAGGSLYFVIDVTGTTAGVKSNTASVSATESGAGANASASITIIAPPTISVALSPSTIAVNDTTTVTYTLTNPNASVGLATTSFSNTLPAGLAFAATPNLVNNAGGTVSLNGSVLSLTSGVLASGASKTISVDLTATSVGSKSVTVDYISDNETGGGPGATATLTVSAPTILVGPMTLTNPTIGVATSQTISGSGGTAPYTYALTAGALPAGLSLSSGGALSGTATAAGTFNFTVTSTDSTAGTGAPFTASRGYALTVSAPAITLAPTTLPPVTVATATSQTIMASGGTAHYTYDITAGALPAGLSLTSNGVLSGTPTAGGTFNFTVTATDSSTGTGPFTGSRAYTFTVNAPTITVAPLTLDAAMVTAATSQTISASGGTAGYTFAVTAGALPAGLSLGTDGSLSGTPTAGGTFSFTVTATDSSTGAGPFFGSRAYSLTIAAPTLALNPDKLGGGVINRDYSATVIATGGTAPYTYTVTRGKLPAGLALAAETGLISGAPTESGSFKFDITATDSSTGTGPFSVSVGYFLPIANVPTVTTPTSDAVTGNTALLGGNITDDGGAGIQVRGVVYSETSINANPQLGGDGVLLTEEKADVGAFTAPVSNLVLGTSYTFAAYATNAVGTGYSVTGTFTTGKTASLVDTVQADFEAGTGTGIDTTTSPDDVILAADRPVDQQNDVDGDYQVSFGLDSMSGQTFTPSVTGPLSKLDIKLGASGMTGTTPDIIVSIRAVQDGHPVGDDLATTTIPGFGGTAEPVYYTATFASPFTVTAGTQYAFVLHLSADPTAGGYYFLFNADDPYAGGGIFAGQETSWDSAQWDTCFRIYVGSGGYATSGDLISDTKDSHLSDGTTHWTTLSWTGSTPDGTTLMFQAAASDSPDGPFEFVGPDGTPDTFFTESGASLDQFYGYQYLQYRAYLSTEDPSVTPVLSDVTVGYDQGIPAPVLSLSFDQGKIPLTESDFLTFTVTNPLSLQLTGVGFTVTLPAGLVVSDEKGGKDKKPPRLSSGSFTVSPDGHTVTFSDATLNSAESISFGLPVTSNGTEATDLTVSGTPSSTESGPGSVASATITITGPQITVDGQLPNAHRGVPYSQALQASHGIAPYTYTFTGGTLPDGITPASDGTLSGTPTATGTYAFDGTVTDSGTGSGPYSATFKTLLVVDDVPTVESPRAADVGGNSVILRGDVANDGGATLLAAGIVLSPTDVNSEPRLDGTGVVTFSGDTTSTPFTVSIPVSGLVLGTQYSFAAYATNAAGTSYSATGTFTTASSGSLDDDAQADFEAGTGTGIDTTTSPGDVILAASDPVDQQNDTIGDNPLPVSFGLGYMGGQTFTPSITGPLSQLDVKLAASGMTGTTPDIIVSIRAVQDGHPVGADLATATIPGFGGTTEPAYYTATFASPLTVTAGTQYAFVLHSSADPTAGGYIFMISDGDPYAGGGSFAGRDPDWNILPNDASFKIHIVGGTSGPVSGDLISPTKDSLLPAGKTHWTTLSWTADTPPGTSVKFQVAASDNPDGPFTFVGPGGTADTYFTESGASLAQFYGHRYLQYRAFLATDDGAVTPVLSDVSVGYDLVAPPTVISAKPADVTGVSATLGGDVTFDGGGIISARGIVLSPTATNADPKLDGTGVIAIPATENGSGTFTVPATNLAIGTCYSFAAYATNQGGTTYSSVSTFTTVAVPVITATTAAGTYGTAFETYTVDATSSPANYTATGLPNGLSFATDTGVISGTPTETGAFNVALTATNVAGTGSASLVLNVAKATLTVTASAQTKVYGSANPTATATFSGFMLDETLATSDVTGAPAYAIAADATTAVGSATITPSLGNLVSSHYDFSFVNGAMSITKYALTVTADPKSRVYGAVNPTPTATITGFRNGQNLGNSGVTGAPVVATTATATTPVGSATITVAAGNLAAANYSFNLVNGTLTISRALLTVTADAKSRLYGAADPTFTAVITGYVNSESATVVRGAASFSNNSMAASPIGNYVIMPALGTLAADNYSFGFATGVLAVTPATLTLVVNAATKVYGAEIPTLTANLTGYVLGQNATSAVVTGAPVLLTTALQGSPVGNYPITVTAGTLAAPNYVFNTTSVFSSNQLTVTKAPLTVRVTDQSRAYGATNATPAVTYSGFVLNESASVLSGAPVATHTATSASPVGSYAITLAAGNLTSPNYAFTLAPGTLNVIKASLTVTADAKSKVYGAVNPAFTATLTGFANSENLASSGVTGTAAFTTTATTSSDVGSYSITPAVGTLTAPNYAFGPFNDGTLTVTAAPVSVALDALSQTYDGQPKSVTVTTTPANIATTVTYGEDSAAPTNAGSYAVFARATSGNYSGSIRGTLVIAQAAQAITFPAPSEVNVGLPLTLSATASSGLPVTFAVLSGSATVTGSQLTVANNGAVVIRATQAGNGNYLPATKDVTLATATLKAQTITFDQPASHLTTDTPFALVATASSGLPVTFTYVSGPATLSGSTVTLNNTAGTVVIRASQAGNASYAAAPDVTRSLTITAKGPQVFFGGFGSQGAKDVSALAVAVGGGIAANLAPDGEDSTLIGYLPTSGNGFVLKFRLASDGSFSATTTAIPNPTATPAETGGIAGHPMAADVLAATTLTFHGQVSGGLLTGTIDELGLPFSAEIQPDTGSTVALAGFYEAAPLNSASGNIYSVVSANGAAFVLAITPTYVGGGTGTVDAGGSFSVSTPQSGVVAGNVNPVTTAVTGTLTLPSQPAQTFAGLGSDTERTDRLVNLSSRARITANAGDSTLITGFVIGGTEPKPVLLRAVGPALANYGVQNAAADPQLRVFDSKGQIIAQNDDWGNDPALVTLASNLGAGPLAAGSKDAAIALTLAPGVYSMHVFTNGASGVALAEIYDAGTTPGYQRLLNISSRGPVSSGEGVLIAGFVVTGNSPKRVLIRGAGPGLAASGVSGVLADPIVRLFNSAGAVIAQNDNWETPVTVGNQSAATAAELTAANTQVGAFAFAPGSKDAALIVVLAPGVYSAQVGSASNGSGNALVEIYEIQ